MHDRVKIAKEFAEAIKSDDIKLIMLFGSVATTDGAMPVSRVTGRQTLRFPRPED